MLGCVDWLSIGLARSVCFPLQKVELLEVVIGFETQNKYAVYNGVGQQVSGKVAA